MKKNHIRTYLPVFLLLLFQCSFAASDADTYGTVAPDNYVTGRFDPAKQEQFVSCAAAGIPARGAGAYHLLRRETAGALKALYAAFRKDHPKAPFWVQSSTRNFYDQKAIWDGKWTGVIKVAGVDLSKKIKNPLMRAREILNYSSMPGTSRHHWGTDFDLNVLSDDYFTKGEGRVLYRWLVINAGRFGFCQPYTAGRKDGYREEKWHWSYAPLSKLFLSRWNTLYRKGPEGFSREGLFHGSDAAGKLAPEYVNSIDSACD